MGNNTVELELRIGFLLFFLFFFLCHVRMNLAVLLWLLLSAIMLTAHGNKPGAKINIQEDEAPAEPGEAGKAFAEPGEALSLKYYTARKNNRSAAAERENYYNGVYYEEKWMRGEEEEVNIGPKDGRLFVIKSRPLSWSDSRDACQARGADLATVQTRKEQTRLREYLVSLLDNDGSGHFRDFAMFTLGATKTDTQSTPQSWRWINGRSFTCNYLLNNYFQWSKWDYKKEGETCGHSDKGCGLFLAVSISKSWPDADDFLNEQGFRGCASGYPLCEGKESTNRF